MKKPSQQPEPHIGIFWLVGTRIISDTTPLFAAGKYGDFKIHDGDHVTYWAALEKRGEVPRDSDYEELPRGRVVFDVRGQQFTLYADRCILRKKEVVKRLMRLMHLPDNTVISTDPHYKCYRCLTRRPSNSTEFE